MPMNHLFNFLDLHSARQAWNPVLNKSPQTPTFGVQVGLMHWDGLPGLPGGGYLLPPVLQHC